MDQQEFRQADRTSRRKEKMARVAVSKRLAMYHQSLVDALSADSVSFFDRVMEAADRNISAQRETTSNHLVR